MRFMSLFLLSGALLSACAPRATTPSSSSRELPVQSAQTWVMEGQLPGAPVKSTRLTLSAAAPEQRGQSYAWSGVPASPGGLYYAPQDHTLIATVLTAPATGSGVFCLVENVPTAPAAVLSGRYYEGSGGTFARLGEAKDYRAFGTCTLTRQ